LRLLVRSDAVASACRANSAAEVDTMPQRLRAGTFAHAFCERRRHCGPVRIGRPRDFGTGRGIHHGETG